MTGTPKESSSVMIVYYYGATVIFLLLDYLLGINVRLAFLAEAPVWRAIYYAFCLICLVLMMRRPGWAPWIGTLESLISLCALIISTALRILIVSDDMIEHGRGFVSISEIVNFLIASMVMYWAYSRGLKSIATSERGGLFTRDW
jgi:hypothetical protein